MKMRFSHPSGVFMALTLGFAAAAPVAAQTTENSFDVIVQEAQLTTGQVGAQGTIAIAGSSLQMRSVQRIANVIRDRKKQPAGSTQQASFRMPSATFVATLASASDVTDEGEFSRWNAFVDLNYATGDQKLTQNAPRYDIDGLGVTAGIDYRASADWVIGGLVTHQTNDNRFINQLGAVDQESLGVAMLSVWYPGDHWYVDAIARYSNSDYEISRLTSSSATTRAGPGGDDYSLGLGLGYMYQQGPLSITPKARVVYIDASIDGYAERDADPSERLAYLKQSVASLTSNIGADANYVINTSWGVLIPQGSLEWVHDFEDEERTVMAQQIETGTQATIAADQRDDNFFRFGLGGLSILPQGNILFAWFETELARDDRNLYSITLGYRREF